MTKEKQNFSNIHSEAEVDKNAFIDTFTIIGKGVKIEKNVYISRGTKIYGKTYIDEETYIGENCIIGHPQRNLLVRIINSKQQCNNLESPQTIIGKKCIIRAGSIIYSEVIMGNICQTGHNILIREKTKIGNNTLIGTNTVIDGNVSIGSNVSIQTGVYIPLYSNVGNNVFMGPYCKLTNDKYMMRKPYDLKGVNIEDNVSLGANSVILPGITLKKGTVVGAGAVVTKDTDENDVIIGNSGKFLRKFS
ncbi:MAG: DapH/DapD/GlmU-related protein [Candidatus Thorarchaeota archaeon]